MFIDARTLADGATLEADVCVAGAGAAGMTIALDLRAAGLSVVLLESGGPERVDETQVLSEGRMIGIDTWNIRAMRIRALGGTTGHWAGWCRPLTPQDFEARDYVNLSGWPIKYSDLLPFYRRACQTVEIGEFDWNSAARAKATGRPLLPVSANIDQRYYQFSPPTRFSRVYAAALEQAADVRVLTFANVRDIRLNQQRGRVESFDGRTLEGTTFHVHAGRYVLALGGIENARVLLASRSQQPEGVANGHGNVGRYFMEHPHYYGSVGVVHPAALDLSFYRRAPSDLKRSDGTPVEVLGALGLAADVSRSEKLLNFSATFQGVGAGRPPSGKAQSDAIPSSTAQELLMRGGGESGATELTVRSEQSPFRDSRVTLTDDLDPLGMPRVALDWRIAPEDDVRMRRAMVVLARELGAAGIARTWVPGDSSRFVWRQDPGGHHMGATRMGTNPSVSVVNADSRTHEVDNLYITGGSVFTTGGDSNPTLTIVALAHRLADTLKRATASPKKGA
ncbi:MAG: GMC family oxidoreductase [Vicinamibacterales bacterium]|nr:GMC family oxidoreductase [Vicinamibacterales bacterium]